MKFLKKILHINFVSILLFISCSDPSENIIKSTIDLMGEKYGPGYATTNGMEGRSHWSFFGENLEIKYNAVNRLTGKVHNATEVEELTNLEDMFFLIKVKYRQHGYMLITRYILIIHIINMNIMIILMMLMS